MKRCPQCEFIYEDDQSLCDMDGVLLVLDSRTLPNLHALATVPVAKTQRRNRAVPAFATLTLALVLGMVYYVSTQRVRTHIPPVDTPSALSVVPVVGAPAPEPQPSAASIEVAKPAAAPPVKKPIVRAAPNPQPAPIKTEPKTEKKDDSKVGSILKKTGRILKKPFKF